MTSGSLTIVEHRHARSRELKRILKDELDAGAEPDEVPVPETVEPHQGAVVVEHDRPFIGVHGAHDHLAHRGLAAPALPDEAEALPRRRPRSSPDPPARCRPPGLDGSRRERHSCPVRRGARSRRRPRLAPSGHPVRTPDGIPAGAPGQAHEAAGEPEPVRRRVLLADVARAGGAGGRRRRAPDVRAVPAFASGLPSPRTFDAPHRVSRSLRSIPIRGTARMMGPEIGMARFTEQLLRAPRSISRPW